VSAPHSWPIRPARGLGGLEAELWQPEPPPALDIGRAAAARGPRARVRRAHPWRSRMRRPPVALAAAATLLTLVAAGVLLARAGSDDPATPSTTLALRPLPGVRGEARLTLAGAEAELRGSGLRPSGAHDYYEAWLADARGRMISMGSFRVGADGRVDTHMPVAVDVSRYQLVDVSLEPDDGDPAHSQRSVLRARLSS
jgi:Anti-sigma-K factor rskA